MHYTVQIEGVEDKEIVSLLENVSQLAAQKETSPANRAALEQRAEKDVRNLLKALQSLAYYEAKIDLSYNFEKSPFGVMMKIDLGSLYTFASFQWISESEHSDESSPFSTLTSGKLGICMNTPALPKKIIEAEELLIKQLEAQGYPLAKISERKVLADSSSKTISVVLYVDSGPLAFFGKTTITGLKRVNDLFFQHKIAWKEGDVYDPDKVNRTLDVLETSGLFNSIVISHDNCLQTEHGLPMEIHLIEAKHRSIGLGFNYDTDLGPGFNIEWENRNIRGMGEKLSLTGNVWAKKKESTLRYIKPNLGRPGQDFIGAIEALSEKTKGFDEFYFSASGTIERQLNDRLRISYGGMFKRLRNWHSDDNGSFNLIKFPLQMMRHQTNSLLDPTEGTLIFLKSTPTLQVKTPRFTYVVNTLTTSGYWPLRKDRRLVLALKISLGSIWGASRNSIPPSERFYAGSDNLLRGYRYMTVSPLNDDNKPIGGRSMMVYSLESRMRATESLGFVLFWDIGNVYEKPWPQLDRKLLQSAGLGIRYHTPVGPLRLDAAFPLKPRKGIDHSFQIYFSIGQAF